MGSTPIGEVFAAVFRLCSSFGSTPSEVLDRILRGWFRATKRGRVWGLTRQAPKGSTKTEAPYAKGAPFFTSGAQRRGEGRGRLVCAWRTVHAVGPIFRRSQDSAPVAQRTRRLPTEQKIASSDLALGMNPFLAIVLATNTSAFAFASVQS